MTVATHPHQVAGKSGVEEHQSGTRNLITSSGETRSQFFQRLRAEYVWDDAEHLKEQVRAECRNRGETKRQAGISAWDAIAKVYPIADAVTWNAFISRSHRAPGISTAADVTDESTALAAAWVGSMQLLGSLATRCSEIADSCAPLLAAVDARLNQEPEDALIVNDDAVRRIVQIMVDDPERFIDHVQTLFARFEPTGSSYSDAVAVELQNVNQSMELCSLLIDEQWPTVSSWLWGTREPEVNKFLTRACEATRC